MELNPDYLQIASSLDAERKSGKVRGPLHGIPFVVKDNIATKDKMETTAGSWALLGSVVPRDAFVIKKLREAGAVLLGKATLSEWADMRSNDYSEGYSARGGQARSPYNLVVNPGGSSSGSAAAVAANQVAFSLGSETDGSGMLFASGHARASVLTRLRCSYQPRHAQRPRRHQAHRWPHLPRRCGPRVRPPGHNRHPRAHSP